MKTKCIQADSHTSSLPGPASQVNEDRMDEISDYYNTLIGFTAWFADLWIARFWFQYCAITYPVDKKSEKRETILSNSNDKFDRLKMIQNDLHRSSTKTRWISPKGFTVVPSSTRTSILKDGFKTLHSLSLKPRPFWHPMQPIPAVPSESSTRPRATRSPTLRNARSNFSATKNFSLLILY